jgi:hypothetical protein
LSDVTKTATWEGAQTPQRIWNIVNIIDSSVRDLADFSQNMIILRL